MTVRRRPFDLVRTFIRQGVEPVPLVAVIEQQILVGADVDMTMTHTCGMEWVKQQQRVAGLLSTFNRVTYGVSLCTEHHAEWVGLKSHHLFDPVSHKITDVTPR